MDMINIISSLTSESNKWKYLFDDKRIRGSI
jgi:hypothetical protein